MSIEEVIFGLKSLDYQLSMRRRALGGDPVLPSTKVIQEAISLLRTYQDVQPNEPLEPDELLEMDGQPVWIDFACGVWALVDAPSRRLWAGRDGRHPMRAFSGRIYRRPPKEET